MRAVLWLALGVALLVGGVQGYRSGMGWWDERQAVAFAAPVLREVSVRAADVLGPPGPGLTVGQWLQGMADAARHCDERLYALQAGPAARFAAEIGYVNALRDSLRMEPLYTRAALRGADALGEMANYPDAPRAREVLQEMKSIHSAAQERRMLFEALLVARSKAAVRGHIPPDALVAEEKVLGWIAQAKTAEINGAERMAHVRAYLDRLSR